VTERKGVWKKIHSRVIDVLQKEGSVLFDAGSWGNAPWSIPVWMTDTETIPGGVSGEELQGCGCHAAGLPQRPQAHRTPLDNGHRPGGVILYQLSLCACVCVCVCVLSVQPRSINASVWCLITPHCEESCWLQLVYVCVQPFVKRFQVPSHNFV